MSKKYDEMMNKFCAVTGKEKAKNGNTVKWVIAIIAVLAAIGGIAYAVYRRQNEDYLEDFEDDFQDDFDDEFFEDEEDDEPSDTDPDEE